MHGVAALGEHAADEQAAMAVGGVFLAANQGHAEALHAGFKARDGRLEAGVVAQTAIKNAAFGVVVGRIRRTPAQFCAEKQIADSRFLQRTLHQLLVELRDVFRVGRAARIHHHLDSRAGEKSKPRLEIVVGMAESEKAAHARTLAVQDSTRETGAAAGLGWHIHQRPVAKGANVAFPDPQA